MFNAVKTVKKSQMVTFNIIGNIFFSIHTIIFKKYYTRCDICEFSMMVGSISTFPLFPRALSFEGTTKRARNYLNQYLKGFIFVYPSNIRSYVTQFTI